MCGIAASLNLSLRQAPELQRSLELMSQLLEHRGPDGDGIWLHERGHVGFAHRRLSIIDLECGDQPMTDGHGNWVTFNGEIYNYRELRQLIGESEFVSESDTEVILRAYRRWGIDCVKHLRGMFAFALWDEQAGRLVCARDRFGIKPFAYTVADGNFLCASEAKALLPFVDRIETDAHGLRDYLTFQFCLAGKTLFAGVRELLPGHVLTIQNGTLRAERYWEVQYEPDFDHTDRWFVERLSERIEDSVSFHLRADVPVGSYLSGGLDSSIVASLAARSVGSEFKAFTGRFADGPAYDETQYARELARWAEFELHETTITAQDFAENIRKIIYHLDYPVAGPGSFPQYMVSGLARSHMKVVLGGQGGDEVFGGYARYLLAYFEQCIKAAIDGTMHNGNFIVTYESIIPNLETLREYKPLMRQFWSEGLFADLDERYFRLIDRAPGLRDVVAWSAFGDYDPFETFSAIFRAENVGKESYFDAMTHFDFKTLLPALLHVEDRVSMAHGLESRVPFVDHEVVEFAAALPADVKFHNGELKHALRRAASDILPSSILERKDKMGFPVPLGDWTHSELRDFVGDLFGSDSARSRSYLDPRLDVDALIASEGQFTRNLWGLMSLELWQQEFHDRAESWRKLRSDASAVSGRA